MTLPDTHEPQVTELEQTPISYTHERFKWYAILVQSGAEKRAKTNLEDYIKRLKLEEYFGQILIPTAMVDKIDAHGKRKKIEQRIMPGYLFVQLDPTNKATFACVKNTQKVTKFVGAQPNHDPQPVPDDEVARIFNKAAETTKAAPSKPQVLFEKGDRVKVIDGPFTSFIGDVDEVKPEKMKLRLLISVFGRQTPVEIEFNKVEKVKET